MEHGAAGGYAELASERPEMTSAQAVTDREAVRDSEWLASTRRIDEALDVLKLTAERLGKALEPVLVDQPLDEPAKMMEVDLPHTAAVVRHANGAAEAINRVSNTLERLISRLAI